MKTLIEGLREVEVEVALTQQQKREGLRDSEGPPPLAVLYEVVPGADMVELHTAIDHAKAFWPGAPLVACRRQTNGNRHNAPLPSAHDRLPTLSSAPLDPLYAPEGDVRREAAAEPASLGNGIAFGLADVLQQSHRAGVVFAPASKSMIPRCSPSST